MSFAPLGAVPLASTLPIWLVSNDAGLTFGGYARGALRIHGSASAILTFSGTSVAVRAGRPIVFTAIAESFVFRADPDDFEFDAVPASFTFRGIPE